MCQRSYHVHILCIGIVPRLCPSIVHVYVVALTTTNTAFVIKMLSMFHFNASVEGNENLGTLNRVGNSLSDYTISGKSQIFMRQYQKYWPSKKLLRASLYLWITVSK